MDKEEQLDEEIMKHVLDSMAATNDGIEFTEEHYTAAAEATIVIKKTIREWDKQNG